MKKSEARILIYLGQVPAGLCYAKAIGTKLEMDYPYLLARLQEMVNKGWIKRKETHTNKKLYLVIDESKIEEARNVMALVV